MAGEKIFGYVPDDSPGKAPTGRCNCPPHHWHLGDSAVARQPVSCMNCGNHWWSEAGGEVSGPPFTPYGEILAASGLLSLDHVRRPPAPGLSPGRFPKTLNRFGYWSIPALNPWAESRDGLPGPYEFDPTQPDRAAHAFLEQHFEERHHEGDRKAIFSYVSKDAHAFRSRWVIEQLEVWRQNGDFNLLVRLMKRYAKNAGKTDLVTLVRTIRKDHRVFRALLDANGVLLNRAMEVAEQKLTSEADAKLIHRHYRALFDSVVPARFTKEQFFDELRGIADRLEERANDP